MLAAVTPVVEILVVDSIQQLLTVLSNDLTKNVKEIYAHFFKKLF